MPEGAFAVTLRVYIGKGDGVTMMQLWSQTSIDAVTMQMAEAHQAAMMDRLARRSCGPRLAVDGSALRDLATPDAGHTAGTGR